MPQALGALILLPFLGPAAGTAYFTIAGATITYASIVGTGLLTVGSILLADLLKPQMPKPSDGQQVIRQAIPNRRIWCGRVKVSGPLMFVDVKVNNAWYEIVAVNGEAIDAFEEIWLNDQMVTVDKNTHQVTAPPQFIDSTSTKCVSIWTSLGPTPNTAYAKMISDFPGIWTADHRGDGIASILAVFKTCSQADLQTVYPGMSPPVVRTVMRASVMWDPRDLTQSATDPTTWAWTENAVLIYLKYLLSEDGARVPLARITPALAEWKAAADVADVQQHRRDGGNEAAFRFAGGWDLNESFDTVRQRMLTAFAGWDYLRPDGALGIKAGVWTNPTVTIDDEAIISYQMTHGAPVNTLVNVVRPKYMSPVHDYKEVDAAPWRNEALIAIYGEITSDMDLTMVPSDRQARGLAKLEAMRTAADWSGEIVTNLRGLAALGERFITVVLSDVGVTITAEVTRFDRLPTGARIAFRSITADAFEFSAVEEGVTPAVPQLTDLTTRIQPPYDPRAWVRNTGSGYFVTVTAAVLPVIPNASGLKVRWVAADGTTATVTGSIGALSLDLPVFGFSAVGSLDLYVSTYDNSGNFSQDIWIPNVLLSYVVPSPPSLTVGSIGTTAILNATAPTDAGTTAVRFWRSIPRDDGTIDSSVVVQIGSPVITGPGGPAGLQDTPGAGTWIYYATAETAAGITYVGPFSTPVSITF